MVNNMKVLGICGLGGAGRELFDLAFRLKRWNKIIFIDKDNYKDNLFLNCEVYSFEEAIIKYSANDIEFVISVGDTTLREKIYRQIIGANYSLAKVIAPNVYIPNSAIIGQGVVIRDNCYISVDVCLEDNVIIQPNAVIGHDVMIKRNSIVSSQSVLAGGVVVGKNVFIAIGCNIKELVKIGNNSIVSIGSSVNKDIEENVIVHGNPAKVISKNILSSAFILNRGKGNEDK